MEATENIHIDSEKQLFLDDRWFSSQHGMTLTVNPPAKCEHVLLPDTPWEEFGIHGYSSVIEYDGRYHMFYDAIAVNVAEKQPDRSICYAVSTDGIHWEKPNVGPYVWNGIRENNIVLPGCNGGVILDLNGPDEHRFKALCIVEDNAVWPESKGAVLGKYGEHSFAEIYLCTSPDGIHWKRHTPCALPLFHDTQNEVFYDTRLRKYVAYVRWSSEGRSVARVKFDDPLKLPWPFKDRPGAPRGPGLSRHRVGDELPEVLKCDALDPPDTDLYTPSVRQYPWAQDVYLSFTTPYRHYPVGDTSDTTLQGKDERGRYQNDGPVDIQLAVSRDGINWTRPDRKPYVPLVLYEPVMVEGFKKKYSMDPRTLDELDARWLAYQVEVITPFLESVKAILRPRQRLSAIVPGNEWDCKRWGLDVASWIKAGILDDLFPLGQRFTKEDVHVDSPESLDFQYFDKLEGREGKRLIPMLYPWNKFQDNYAGWRRCMFSFLDQGADGYAVWDGTSHLAHIGDIGYEARRSELVSPKMEFRAVKLLTMNGYRFDRYHHFEVV